MNGVTVKRIITRPGRPRKHQTVKPPRYPPLPFQATRDHMAAELRRARDLAQPAPPFQPLADVATTGVIRVQNDILGPHGKTFRFDLTPAQQAAAIAAQDKRAQHDIMGLSASSRRSRATDWLTWLAFCAHHDCVVLPATFDDLAKFIRSLIDAGRKKATIEHILWSIANVHTRYRLPDPMANPDAADFWRDRVREDLHGEQAQAAPLRKALLDRLVVALETKAVRPRRAQPRLRSCVVAAQRRRRLRDIAMLHVAYDLLTRASELVGMKWERLTKARDGSGLYRFGKTKTDQAGKGSSQYLRPKTMEALMNWRAACSIGDYIFHPVSDDMDLPLASATDDAEQASWEARMRRGSQAELRMLTKREVGIVFRRACVIAGVSLKRTWLSGHSARVGAAQDMAAAGLSTVEMQLAGRWASERMPVHYAAQVKATQTGKRRFKMVSKLTPGA